MTYNKSSNPSGNTSSLPNSAANLSPDLYTGKLQASLPLFVMESSDLKIPIALNYTAGGGVKINDPNNDVGMDWNLFAGGSISRVVRGIPDESDEGYIGSNSQQIYGTTNEGLLAVNAFNNPSTGNDILFNNVESARVVGKGPIDGEPDIFYISTPSFNAQFVIDENGNVVFQNNTGLKVIHQLYKNPNAIYTGFTVIDDHGNQYLFGTQASAREMTTTKFFGQSFTYNSTWYLEKIILFNSKDLVNFTYIAGKNDTVNTTTRLMDYTSTFPAGSGFPPTTTPTSFSSIDDSRPVQVGTIVYNDPKYISQISTKLGEADFTYTYNANQYLNTANPPTLTSITIKQFNPAQNANNIILKTFNFSYTDLESSILWTQPYSYTDLWGLAYRRLLSGITVTGNTSQTSTPLPLYNLKYYELLPYPERIITTNIDYWGYTNSEADNVLNASYFFTNPDQAREPASWNQNLQTIPMAAIFALQEIDDMNGGSTTIDYEQNTYYNGTYNVPIGGTRVSNIIRSIPGGQSLNTNYVYNDANGISTGQIWSDLYKRVTMNFNSACCDFHTLCYPMSPYGIADDNGVFVGYSAVKTVSPNGGYQIDKFTDFSDYPDIIATPSAFAASANLNNPFNSRFQAHVLATVSSFSYKRGLLKNSATYTSGGNMISQISNTYGSLDAQPVAKGIGIQDMTWYFNSSLYLESLNVYNINVENWRLTQTTRTDYDQLNSANYVQTTSNYTYAANKRLLQSISTTDSKGMSRINTFYHADDASIPMVTPAEQTAITTMLGANCSNVLIHQTDSRNGVIHQIHNIYTIAQYGDISNVYLAADASYAGTTLTGQNNYNYNASNSQLLSSIKANDKPISVAYGYNASYPVAEVTNASNTASFATQQGAVTGTINLNAGQTGTLVVNFITTTTGTITVACPPGAFLASRTGGVTVQLTCSLSGPASVLSNICENSASGYTCTFGTSANFTNMPAGTYALTLGVNNNTSTIPVAVTYSYTGNQIVPAGNTEFFFEGFEQSGAPGNAHTGNMYSYVDYFVPFVTPNNRKYLIQWWSLISGKWVFNEQPYVANTTLAGPVDDVRIFPADAQMTTYTFSPLVGKTSETDPSGKSQTFEYDGLGRILRIRDQDGNILKQYDYQYQVGLQQ